MVETYVERFLSSLFYSYSEELDKNNIDLASLSIFPDFTLKLKDIVIYKNSFLQHGLPLYVRNGIISDVFMKIKPENSTINITNIFFYLSFVDSHNFPDPTIFKQIRDHQLYAHELFKDNFSYITNKLFLSKFKQIIKNTIRKSTITINNAYICLELSDSIVSIFIDHIILIGDPTSNENQDLTLNLAIINLQILMLPKPDQSIFDLTDNSTFSQSMTNYFQQNCNLNNSDYILNINEIDGTVLYTNDQQIHVTINNENKIETLLNLKLWQVSSLIKVIPEISKFRNHFITRFIEKPSFENPGDSWHYFHRCAAQLNANQGRATGRVSPLFSQFVKGFINRNKYLKTWQGFKRQPFNPVLLDQLDHSLTYHQITLFRYLTELLREKWIKRPLTQENVYEALDFIEMDVPNLLTFLIKSSTININLSKVIFNVYFQDATKYLFTLSLMKPTISLSFDKSDNFIIDSSFCSFKLKDNTNSALIETVENEPDAFKFKLAFYSKSYQLNKNIKENSTHIDNETIYNDLTVMRIQCFVSNQNFVFSTLDILNCLAQIDLSQMILIASSLFKLDSMVNDNRNTSFLDSILEMVDIDFCMDNCQFSLILNETCQLNYIADAITLKRELQKLEMEIQKKSVNSKIKKSEHIRTLFKKSDLSFDINSSSVVFAYDKFNHILVTSISVHAIFMASKKELLVFISPLYVSSNWFQIKKLCLIVADYIKSFHKKKNQNNIKIEIPDFLKQIKISGGIPTITFSLDFPAFPSKLFELVIDTVKFEGSFEDEIKLIASVNKISFENLLEIVDTKVDLNENRFEFEKVRFAMLKTLSVLPKDALEIVDLSPLTSNFSFLMKTLNVDLGVDWIENSIDYTVTNFGGYSDYMNDGSLKLTAFVNDISINHKPIILNQEVTAQIDLDKSINIFVDFGDLDFHFQHDLLDFMFNSDMRVKDIFPKNFALNWKIKVNSLLIDPIVRIENCWVYLTMSDLMFGGDIFFETLEVIHMKIEKKNPISLSLDLSRHYLSAVIDFDYVEIDILPFLSLLQYFIHFPFHINIPMTCDLKILPVTFGLIINPDRPIHPILNIYNDVFNETQTYKHAFYINMRSTMYFNGERISANLQLNDFDLFYNDHKFLTIPNITIFGERQWSVTIPSIDISFNSLLQILDILNNFSKIPALSLRMWNFQHSLLGILTSISISSCRLLFSQSLLIDIQNILASINNNEFNIRCDINSLIYSTWFSCHQISKIDDLKLYFCLKSQNLVIKLLNENPINIQIDDKIVNEVYNILNSDVEKPFLTIKNETNYDFDTKYGPVHPKTSLSYFEYIHDDEIQLNSEFSRIMVRKDELTNQGEIKVSFDNIDFYISLNHSHELKINTNDSIKNKSSAEFTFEYDSQTYTIQPNSLMNFNFEIGDSFKLNGKEIAFKPNQTEIVFNDLYMIKRLKRLILIQSQFFLVNELPFDLKIDQITYKSGSTSELLSPILNQEFVIIESNSFKTQRIELNLLKNHKYLSLKLETIYDFNVPFVIRIQFLENRNGSRKLVISPSAIIRSKLNNLLVSPDKENCFSMKKNTDFACSMKKKMISRVFLTISEDFGFSEIVLNEKDVNRELVILNSNNDEFQIYPFIIEREIKSYPYYNIEILTIKPYITIRNELNDKLFIYYPDSRYIIIEAHQTVEIEQFESTLDFCFSVGKVSNLNQLLNSIHLKENGEINQYPFILNFKTIRSEKVVLNGSHIPIEIHVNSVSENSSKIITFSICKSFSYQLINLSNYSLFIQKREFKPKTASLFTPSQKFLNKNDKLKISIKEANHKILLGEIGQQKVQCREKRSDTETITISTENYQDDLLGQFETTLYAYEEHSLVHNSVVRTVVVSEDIEDINKFKYHISDSVPQPTNFENRKISLKVSLEALFSKIVLVLFNGQNAKEITFFAQNLLIVASSQQLNSNQNENQMNGLRLSIGKVEMLDFYKNCLLLSKDETEFLSIFADNLFSQFHIEKMKISVNPFYFNANLAIFLSYFKLFNNFKQFIQRFSGELNIPTILDNGLIENLIVDPISLLFEFDTSSPNFSSFFRIIPSVKPVHFSTQKMELENVRFKNKQVTRSSIKFDNRELSKKEKVYLMVKNSLKFVLSLHILGAPVSLFETMFLDYSKPFHASFKKFRFSTLFIYFISIFDNIVDYARSFCYCLSGQDNPRPKDESSPLVWGFTSLFMSVFNAFTLSLSVLFRDKKLIQPIFAFLFTILGGIFDGACGLLTFLKSFLDIPSDFEKEFRNDDSSKE